VVETEAVVVIVAQWDDRVDIQILWMVEEVEASRSQEIMGIHLQRRPVIDQEEICLTDQESATLETDPAETVEAIVMAESPQDRQAATNRRLVIIEHLRNHRDNYDRIYRFRLFTRYISMFMNRYSMRYVYNISTSIPPIL